MCKKARIQNCDFLKVHVRIIDVFTFYPFKDELLYYVSRFVTLITFKDIDEIKNSKQCSSHTEILKIYA